MRTNWPQIKARYLSGRIGLRELARSENVPFSTLGKMATREGWAREREQKERFRNALETVTVNAALEAARQKGRELAAAVSLPERSRKLCETVVAELEKDAAYVASEPPKSLEHAAVRQGVIGQVARTAGITLGWDSQQSVPGVRLHVLASVRIADHAPANPAPVEAIDVIPETPARRSAQDVPKAIDVATLPPSPAVTDQPNEKP